MNDKIKAIEPTIIERLRAGVVEFPVIVENPALIMDAAADALEAAELERNAAIQSAVKAQQTIKEISEVLNSETYPDEQTQRIIEIIESKS